MNQKIEVNGQTIWLKVSPYHAQKGYGYYKQKIFDAFDKIGVKKQYVDIQMGGGSGYRSDSWAQVSWYVNGESFEYRCNTQSRDVDNLAAISQVIEQDSKSIRRGLKTFGMVMNQFKIGFDGSIPKSPYEILGVPEGIKDEAYIDFVYKQKAKKLHPDAGGDVKKFQELQEAYGQVKKAIKGGAS